MRNDKGVIQKVEKAMMIVKIKNCDYKAYEGMEVKAHYIFSNGINFITRIGMVFVPTGDYEVIADIED